MTTITVFLNGHGIPERDALGEPIVDDSFLLLFNPLAEDVTFTLPRRGVRPDRGRSSSTPPTRCPPPIPGERASRPTADSTAPPSHCSS